MLEHLLDVGFVVGSCITDNTTTYFSVRKYGLGVERNLKTQEGMAKNGVVKYLLKSGFMDAISLTSLGVIGFGLDSLFGIKDNYINIHHVALYGMGGLKYIATATNIAAISGMHKTARAISFPVRLCLKALGEGRNYDF
jgi:hypothetical protein